MENENGHINRSVGFGLFRCGSRVYTKIIRVVGRRRRRLLNAASPLIALLRRFSRRAIDERATGERVRVSGVRRRMANTVCSRRSVLLWKSAVEPNRRFPLGCSCQHRVSFLVFADRSSCRRFLLLSLSFSASTPKPRSRTAGAAFTHPSPPHSHPHSPPQRTRKPSSHIMVRGEVERIVRRFQA